MQSNNNLPITKEQVLEGLKTMFAGLKASSGEEFRSNLRTETGNMLTNLGLATPLESTDAILARQRDMKVVMEAANQTFSEEGDDMAYNSFFHKWLLSFIPIANTCTSISRANSHERMAFISVIKTIMIDEISKVIEVTNQRLLSLETSINYLRSENSQIKNRAETERQLIDQERNQYVKSTLVFQENIHSKEEQIKDKEEQIKDKEEQIKDKDVLIKTISQDKKKQDEQYELIKNKLQANEVEMRNFRAFFERVQEQNTELINQSMNESKMVKDDQSKIKQMIEMMMAMMMERSNKSNYNTNDKKDQQKILDKINLVESQEINQNPRKVSEVESELCNDNQRNSFVDMLKKQEAGKDLGGSNISIIQ